MFKSDEQVEVLINNPVNLAKLKRQEPRRQIENLNERREIRDKLPSAEGDQTVIKPLHNGGRRPGDKNLSLTQRADIAVTAKIDGIDRAIEVHGVSKHHAYELANGKVTNAEGKDEELIAATNSKLERPHDLAVERLTQTLLAITPDKIERMTKVKDLAGVAVALSSVVRSTAPVGIEGDADKSAKLVVYAPSFKQENHYATVQAPKSKH